MSPVMKSPNNKLMNMKILRLLLVMLVMLPSVASAKGKKSHGPADGDRKEWMQKMKEFKHSFLVGELDLSERQSEEFFKLYDEMERERFEVDHRVRELQKAVLKKDANPTDRQLDECITAQYGMLQAMADIDRKYEPEFRKILSKRQLCKLPQAEREFQRKLMESRRDCPPPRRNGK